MKHVSIPHLEGLSAIRRGLLYPHQADGVAFRKSARSLPTTWGSARPAKPLSGSKAPLPKVMGVPVRRKTNSALDLPPKIRSWVPVDISDAPGARSIIEGFLDWYQGTDPAQPNDKQFLARLTKVRVAPHKAKHKAVAERVKDVVATGGKVVVFTTFNDGVARHA
jgi:hypothetical protein